MNNISNKCKKKFQNASLWAVFLFWLFFVFPFLLIILVVLFFNKKLSLSWIYKIIWIKDCLDEMSKNLKRKVDKKIENDYKSDTSKQKTKYLELMNDLIKKRSEDLKRKEKLEKKEDYTEVLEYIDIDKTNEDDKALKNNYSTNSWNKHSSKYNSFNKWKSIWDDYESVFDIMKKNK